jgi:hypothetical protein
MLSSSFVKRLSPERTTLHEIRFTDVENAAGGLYQQPASRKCQSGAVI